ncbi:MAG: PhzF family phenazine biosynthesis protein [Bryobacteraceae bacterium]
MHLPIYQVDAFTSTPFRGNPAAICPLESWLPDALMQSIAEENNLAETAFYVREGEAYRIRWFTPTVEVELCGHATLAAASVAMQPGQSHIAFVSLSGNLAVDRDGDRYTLDFPCIAPKPAPSPAGLTEALNTHPNQVLQGNFYMCVFDREEQVQALSPDMAKLSQVDCFGIIATAPGENCDFVSRVFAPRAGIPEDPVTGGAHSTLIPYWSARLGKQQMFARQISKRGGELWCEDRGPRVGIGGNVVRYLEGRIRVP